MSSTICAFHCEDWVNAGLMSVCEFLDFMVFCNQSEGYVDVLEGEWYYDDEDNLTVYHGTFGNDNSPGALMHTYATICQDREEYEEVIGEWLVKEEWVDDYAYEEPEDIRDEGDEWWHDHDGGYNGNALLGN